MSSGFSQKEMLVRIMDKLDRMDDKLNKTHEKAVETNGKVKLHTKLITGLGGALIVVVGWIISIILK